MQQASNRATNKILLSKLIAASCLGLATFSAVASSESQQILQAPDSDESQKLVIWGESKERKRTDTASPRSLLTPEDMLTINATTTEDLVKHEPSLVIRKRFIGDSNGTIGIRGSNMFQTSRSMVFADGVPLHYLLQNALVWRASLVIGIS